MQNTLNRAHWSFWLITTLALLWNIGGSINYLMQMKADFVATLPETHKAIIIGRPVWATGGFAIGVFTGGLACIFLLFRKSIAIHVFTLSLIGILVTMIHTVNVAYSKITFSFLEMFVMILLPVIVAVFLIWYSRLAKTRQWIH